MASAKLRSQGGRARPRHGQSRTSTSPTLASVSAAIRPLGTRPRSVPNRR